MSAELLRPPSGRAAIVATALAAALLALAFAAPRFWLWPAVGLPLRDLVSVQPELHRAFFALQQLANPWGRIDSDVNRVIEWRLLWPLLGHYAGMSRDVYLALPFVGCVVALGATARFVRRATGDIALAFGAALLAATTSWFFVSTGWLAYFDSWLVLALLLASFARTRAALISTAFLAPWVDERFLLALPLCLGVRALDPEQRTRLREDAACLLGGIAPYVALRFGGELLHVRSTSTTYWSQHRIPPAPAAGMLAGLWHGLRLAWLPALALLIFAARDRRWLAVLAIVVSLAVNVCMADDLSRSASVALPLLVAGIVACAARGMPQLRLALATLCVGNLALPAAHIIATPLSVTERYHLTPVRNLLAERAQRAHPPPFADPAVYTQRGIEALGANELAIAAGQFELALRFDPEFARARAHRGIVLYTQGHAPEGLAEIDRALQRDPAMFDVRLQRATFRQRSGDVRGALADAREALRGMPADWPRRREAERFARALAAQVDGTR